MPFFADDGTSMPIGKRVWQMLSLFLMTMMASAAFAADSETLVPFCAHKYLRYAGATIVAELRSPTQPCPYVRENPKPKMLLPLRLQLLSPYSCRGCNAPRPHATPVRYGEQIEASVHADTPA